MQSTPPDPYEVVVVAEGEHGLTRYELVRVLNGQCPLCGWRLEVNPLTGYKTSCMSLCHMTKPHYPVRSIVLAQTGMAI